MANLFKVINICTYIDLKSKINISIYIENDIDKVALRIYVYIVYLSCYAVVNSISATHKTTTELMI